MKTARKRRTSKTAQKSSNPANRFRMVGIGFLLLAGILLGRAAQVQVIGDARLEHLADRQFSSKILIRPRRGLVLDRNGEPLAVNAEIQSLAANPSAIGNPRRMAKVLSRATGVSSKTLYDRLKSKREFAWIKRHLSRAELNRLKKLGVIDGSGSLLEGLWMVHESQRVYPHRELAAHVLGAVSLDSEGLEGVELLSNELLRGKVVRVAAIRDALGRPSFMDASGAARIGSGADGENLQLTIDSALQFAVEQHLTEAVDKTGAQAGSVIVMDSETGEILAMANRPSFDPNQMTESPVSHRRNRAVTDGYEPGSTIKPILVATALEHGARLTDRIYAEKGSIVIQGKRISEAESHEKFEWLSLQDLVKLSSNVASAKLAVQLGTKKFRSMLLRFGLTERTGIDFPGEIAGRLPGEERWSDLTLANVGFGQGLLVTRIQMARAYAAIANGGYLVTPKLSLNSPIERKRILKPSIAAKLSAALESVTGEGGTGTSAAMEGFRVAGKTGTAQVVDPRTGRYSDSRYISSFIGFPLEWEKKIVIFASLDGPKGSYYAAQTAAPLFRGVLAAAANRFGIHPALAESPRIPTRDRIQISSAHPTPVKMPDPTPAANKPEMPDLKGLSLREALKLLEGRAVDLSVHGEGMVVRQAPNAGQTLSPGTIVKLDLES